MTVVKAPVFRLLQKRFGFTSVVVMLCCLLNVLCIYIWPEWWCISHRPVLLNEVMCLWNEPDLSNEQVCLTTEQIELDLWFLWTNNVRAVIMTCKRLVGMSHGIHWRLDADQEFLKSLYQSISGAADHYFSVVELTAFLEELSFAG